MSQLHRLISQIEQSVVHWNQHNLMPPPVLQEKKIEYRGTNLVLLYCNLNSASESQTASADSVDHVLLDKENCFMHHDRDHHLCKWFGIRQFFIVTTAPGEYSYSDAGMARMLLSALCIALNDAQCGSIPCFAALGDPNDRNYIGRWSLEGEHINFTCETARDFPAFYSTLSGQLDMFSLAMGRQALISRSIRIAARFTYNLNGEYATQWRGIIARANERIPIFLMDFGTLIDPIESLCVSCQWKPFEESSLSTAEHDLKPEHADFWNISCTLHQRFVSRKHIHWLCLIL